MAMLFYRTIKRLDTFLHKRIVSKRKPDFIIPFDKKHTYMERYFLIPRNKIFNIYLHQFNKPDPDHTLHDHPWCSVSLILFSGYQELTMKYGGVMYYKDFTVGNVHFMTPWHTHRISQVHGEICRTLFITGPVIREWGFHSMVLGWLDHKTYKERMKND